MKGGSIVPGIFTTLDKAKPIFDTVDKAVMFLCKILLIVDILITSMAVAGRFIEFIPDPSWSEEVVLSCMSYMAVLSAALAIRHIRHIRVTALDRYLPKKIVMSLDVLSDVCVLAFGVVMLVIGWEYASTIGSRGTYVSMPSISRFWMYLPIPLAGVAMIIFQLEVLYQHIKAFFIKEESAA